MDILERFLQFEKDNDLFSRAYCGEHYWHFIRFGVYHQIRGINESEDDSYDNSWMKSSSQEKIKKFLRIVLCAVKMLFMKSPKKADILVNDQNTYINIDGIRTNVFIDPLEKFFDMQHAYISVNYKTNLVRKYPNSSTAMLKLFVALFLSKVLNIYDDIKEEIFLDTLNDTINCEFGTKIKHLKAEARNSIILSKTISVYAKKLLKKVQPKAILTKHHYNGRVFVLTNEAKRLGIPVIELQHGMIGLKHAAYNFIDTAASAPYFPDYILTYGNYWTDNIRLPQGSKAITAGYLYSDDRIKKLAEIKRQKKAVFFYSNFNLSLIDVLVSFHDIAKSNGYTVVCKMHPREYANWKTYYPSLYRAGIQVIDTPVDIYELFLSGTHHVGAGSTTMLEAIATHGHVHIHSSARIYLDDMLQLGAAKEFTTAEELMDNILLLDCDASFQKNNEIADYLFEPNALENQIDIIKRIIS